MPAARSGRWQWWGDYPAAPHRLAAAGNPAKPGCCTRGACCPSLLCHLLPPPSCCAGCRPLAVEKAVLAALARWSNPGCELLGCRASKLPSRPKLLLSPPLVAAAVVSDTPKRDSRCESLP